MSYLAVFGAVWGGVEMILGGILHSMHIPMRGMILSVVGAFILCSGRLWIGGRGTAFTIGCIAAFLKLFSIGGLVLSPAAAILMESLVAEAIFALLGAGRLGCMVSGMGIVFYTIPHKLFSVLVVYRREFADFLEAISGEGGILLEFGLKSVTVILAVYILIHLFVGALSGFAAHSVVGKARARFTEGTIP